ncbi:MAG: hypothetical protein LBI35_07260 [Burkholderiales bacterium]|jgi:hypothetical protein|nr:hypothetical protein [Burkholderiales bacterium]
MSVIWKFIQPLIGPALIVVGTLGAVWGVYNEGKSVGRASYVDEIVACETRRAEDWAKLIADRESLLAERVEMLAVATKKLEEAKNETERLRREANEEKLKSVARHAALDVALTSLRNHASAANSDSAVPGDSTSAGEPDGETAECRPCTDELEAMTRRAAHDALTVFEWQAFYEKQRNR